MLVTVIVLVAVAAVGAYLVARRNDTPSAQPGPSMSADTPGTSAPPPTVVSSSEDAPRSDVVPVNPVEPSTPVETSSSGVAPRAEYPLTLRQGPLDDGDCAAHAFGEIHDLLARRGCAQLSRSLYSTHVTGRPVAVSVVRVVMYRIIDLRALARLDTINGTGDVRTVVADGYSYPGGPDTWSDDPTFLATIPAGSEELLVVEAMWTDGGATHEHTPALTRLLNAVVARVG